MVIVGVLLFTFATGATQCHIVLAMDLPQLYGDVEEIVGTDTVSAHVYGLSPASAPTPRGHSLIMMSCTNGPMTRADSDD